jgi:hypothetical protein
VVKPEDVFTGPVCDRDGERIYVNIGVGVRVAYFRNRTRESFKMGDSVTVTIAEIRQWPAKMVHGRKINGRIEIELNLVREDRLISSPYNYSGSRTWVVPGELLTGAKQGNLFLPKIFWLDEKKIPGSMDEVNSVALVIEATVPGTNIRMLIPRNSLPLVDEILTRIREERPFEVIDVINSIGYAGDDTSPVTVLTLERVIYGGLLICPEALISDEYADVIAEFQCGTGSVRIFMPGKTDQNLMIEDVIAGLLFRKFRAVPVESAQRGVIVKFTTAAI